MKKENIFNIPNLLSAYRLLMAPVILVTGIKNNEHLFAVLLCVNLASDVLDGFIARTFKLTTKFGAQLDNLADFGTYALAVFGIFQFKWHDIQSNYWLLLIFLGIFMISNFIGWIKFRKMPGMHLYSCVTTGYLQGIFFFVLFAHGFEFWLYALCLGFGILAYTEKIIILLVIDEIKAGMKGLYWILKSRRENKLASQTH